MVFDRKKTFHRARFSRRNLVIQNKYARSPRSKLSKSKNFAFPLKNGMFITSSGQIVSKTGKVLREEEK